MICWKCHKEIKVEKVERADECPLCHADLHVCKNCNFYESGLHNDCEESSAEFNSDKERSNFCSYFTVKKDFLSADNLSSLNDKADAARASFNALFGQ